MDVSISKIVPGSWEALLHYLFNVLRGISISNDTWLNGSLLSTTLRTALKTRNSGIDARSVLRT